MNFIWNINGVKIMSITMNRWEGQEMWTSGYLHIDHGSGAPRVETVQWEACAKPEGWYVELTRGSGRVGGMQGATFNLPLEVASIAKRLL